MNRIRRPHAAAAFLLGAFALGAQALECGRFDFPFCANATSAPRQYAGGFSPNVGFGGFGGGACKDRIAHTPVVFIHGNGDSAIGWDAPPAARSGEPAQPSVYRAFKAQGYNDCELFGVTYLSADEQVLSHTSRNFHRPRKYRIVWQFIQAVKQYTGKSRVDIVGHSLGVSMALAALDYYADRGRDSWGSVRRFVNIAGGIHGLNSCVPGIIAAATCQGEHGGSKNAYYEFGFFPDLALPWLPNRWTAVSGDHAMRLAPRRHPDVAFYTVHAGAHDDIHCPSSLSFWPAPVDCRQGPLFTAAANVRSQLDIGADPASPPPSWTATVGADVARLFPRDLGGIGHFGARNEAGPIIAEMLTTDCRGASCADGYEGSVQPAAP